MALDTSKYPTLMQLALVETEIKVFLDSYRSQYDAFITSLRVRGPDPVKDKEMMNSLNFIREWLVMLEEAATTLLAEAEAKGVENQEEVDKHRQMLDNLSMELNKRQIEVDELAEEQRHAVSMLDTAKSKADSSRMHYVAAAVVAIVVTFLGARTLLTDDLSNIDLAVGVVGAAVLIYMGFRRIAGITPSVDTSGAASAGAIVVIVFASLVLLGKLRAYY
jgi:hypothetical protein